MSQFKEAFRDNKTILSHYFLIQIILTNSKIRLPFYALANLQSSNLKLYNPSLMLITRASGSILILPWIYVNKFTKTIFLIKRKLFSGSVFLHLLETEILFIRTKQECELLCSLLQLHNNNNLIHSSLKSFCFIFIYNFVGVINFRLFPYAILSFYVEG